MIADLIAREMFVEDASFSFHGLHKNACCYLVECGINDSAIGEILSTSPEMVGYYSKRARALMITRGAADRKARRPAVSGVSEVLNDDQVVEACRQIALAVEAINKVSRSSDWPPILGLAVGGLHAWLITIYCDKIKSYALMESVAAGGPLTCSSHAFVATLHVILV